MLHLYLEDHTTWRSKSWTIKFEDIWGYLRIFEDYPRIIRQSLNNGLSQPSLLAGVAAKPSRVTSCKEELNRHQLSLGQHGVQRERSEVWFIPISVFQPASLGPNPWWAMYKEKFCWAPTVRPTCWAVTVIRCRIPRAQRWVLKC